jgi:hypothetical protein
MFAPASKAEVKQAEVNFRKAPRIAVFRYVAEFGRYRGMADDRMPSARQIYKLRA